MSSICTILKYSLFCQTMALASACVAFATPLQTTQSNLKQLNQKIGHLEQRVKTFQSKKENLNQTLQLTDRKISDTSRQLYDIQHKIVANQKEIATLVQKTEHQERALKKQEEMLKVHLKERYQMGEYQPLKWLLNQESPDEYSRILTLYHYVIRQRMALIEEIAATRASLTSLHQKTEQELKTQQRLQHELSSHHQKLAEQKAYEKALMAAIEKNLDTQTKSLEEAKRNRDNLARLLKSLAQKPQPLPQYPILKMQRKLQKPLAHFQNTPQRRNQGVLFKAREGEPVHAVYPGRVVFSDWLNGYGLLTIIDHGQGMMSLYAHQQSLYKKKGEMVRLGETIGTVGHTGTNRENGLYFEIRQRGRAVSPMQWLA